MSVAPLAVHSPRAVREVLRAHGWDQGRADAAAKGIGPVAFHLDHLSPAALLALVQWTTRAGIEALTGEDWALLAGSRSRLGALTRAEMVPPELAGAAEQLGRLLEQQLPEQWVTARGAIALDRPVVMGILNVTPDSFSDGGRFARIGAALAHADGMVENGAGLIDVGGESTRPGNAAPVEAEEERRRVVPVIEALVKRHPGVPVSVDTVKAEVAKAALDAGAAVINDVSGFRLDPALAPLAAASHAGVVLMHSRGTVADMASLDHAHYEPDVVSGVRSELAGALERARHHGVAPHAIVLDPGLGFGKTPEQNLILCDRLAELASLGRPLLVGPSRKRFLGAVTGRDIPERDEATAAACVVAYERGARLFRVHDVRSARDALGVAHAIRSESC